METRTNAERVARKMIEMANKQIEEASPAKPKPKLGAHPKFVMPLLVGGVIFTIAALQLIGIIDIRGILNPNTSYEITPQATIGKPVSYDFSTSELTSLLPPESTGGPYTYYLGSGVGFPPMGLTLDINGILSGTPTGQGGKFQVCVKDIGGRSVCKDYHLTVNPEGTQDSSTAQNQQYKCPASGIEAGCGSHPNGPNGPTVDGIPLPLKCPCPPGTKFDRIVTWQDKQYNQCMCQ